MEISYGEVVAVVVYLLASPGLGISEGVEVWLKGGMKSLGEACDDIMSSTRVDLDK